LNNLIWYFNGTTFSGHPTSTTLGNTLRSLCYNWFYLEEGGYKDPWIQDHLTNRMDADKSFVLVAGDDVCMWVDKDRSAEVSEKIRSLTSREKESDVPIGLG